MRQLGYLSGWVVAGLFLVFVACGDDLTSKEMFQARKIYVAKCAKCHRFYEPRGYSEPIWRTWMDKMLDQSKLKGESARLLNRYLDAYRAGHLPGKPEDKPRESARTESAVPPSK